ncbi:MAG: glycosyltransferase family 4 protein [Solirubrobacteraceae bacterium]
MHYPAFGGPHNRVLRIAKPLRELGWETKIVLPTEPGNAAPWLSDSGVKVTTIPLSRIRRIRDPRVNIHTLVFAPKEIGGLRKEIRRWNPDVVLVGNLVMPHAAIAARLENRAVLWQIVDTSVPRILQRLVMPFVRHLADGVIYGGASLRQQHHGTEGLPQPYFVIPPPVDTARFVANNDSRRQVRHELGIEDDVPIIGQVVAINPKKGLEGFLYAAAEIVKRYPQARFLIIGSAHDAHKGHLRHLESVQAGLGLTHSQILWLGDKTATERYYAAMDVFAISSVPQSEGTTTTAMEALACGVPVVATDVGAVSEVVRSGENGYIVQSNNPPELARQVEVLLANPRLRQEFGVAGRARMCDHFDVSMCVSRYIEAFDASLKHREPSKSSSSLEGVK